MWGGTKALLDAHIKDCQEDRARTGGQFEQTSKKLDKLEKKLEDAGEARERQHTENQVKFDKLSRLIYMAVGAISLLGFLFSDTGRGLLHVLSISSH